MSIIYIISFPLKDIICIAYVFIHKRRTLKFLRLTLKIAENLHENSRVTSTSDCTVWSYIVLGISSDRKGRF